MQRASTGRHLRHSSNLKKRNHLKIIGSVPQSDKNGRPSLPILFLKLLVPFLSIIGHRKRRFWMKGDHLHVEIHELPEEVFSIYDKKLRFSLKKHAGVKHIEINGRIARVIINFDQS